jgi:hypothetical protein
LRQVQELEDFDFNRADNDPRREEDEGIALFEKR